MRDWDKISIAPRSIDLRQMVAQYATLNSFFVKPFQRLTKYPLMLSVWPVLQIGKALKFALY
jgi:cell division control protein 24